MGGPGIDAGPPAVGKDKAAAEEKDTPAPAVEEKDPMVEDTPAEEGTGSKDKEGQGSAMSEVGLSESEPESPGPRGDEAAPEEPPPPPPSPYTIVANFGFTTENAAVCVGLRCLADIELCVPVLRLNLDKVEDVVVADVFCRCVSGLRKSTRSPFLRRSC